MTREDRDADARRQLERDAVDQERLVERAANALTDEERARRVGSALEDERELVAAEARDGVTRARDTLESPGEMLQDRVTGLVPEGVVDFLEAVQVEQHQREARAVSLRGQEGLLEAVVEEPAIRKLGERVV